MMIAILKSESIQNSLGFLLWNIDRCYGIRVVLPRIQVQLRLLESLSDGLHISKMRFFLGVDFFVVGLDG
jgi:hypothetical protein